MSQRSIRRAQQRKVAADRRREALRRRRATIAAGAAIGATVLFAPAARADNFEVTSLADGPADACDADCTVRDAVTDSNATGVADTITFKSGLTGTIRLTQGALVITGGNDLTIEGPGAGVIAVSGDADDSGDPSAGDTYLFGIQSLGQTEFSGLTLTEGVSNGGGGAIAGVSGSQITVKDSVLTDNTCQSGNGGAIRIQGDLTITDSVLTGNAAASGDGGAIYYIPGNGDGVTISGSTISGNSASGNGGGIANGGMFAEGGRVEVTESEISGNTSGARGGGIRMSGRYLSLQVTDSAISGNSATTGGGVDVATNPSSSNRVSNISRTTISGNRASVSGAGVYMGFLARDSRFTVSGSTISGNEGGAGSFGGGLMFGDALYGTFRLLNSTVSGNTAAVGAGLSVGSTAEQRIAPSSDSLQLEDSTIASNSSSARGGGIYLGQYNSTGSPVVKTSSTIPLESTIVADNTAAGSPQDLDRVATSTGGGFEPSLSLVESPGNAPVMEGGGGPNVIGLDPQLGPLADNGGATKTHLPAQASPAVDQGESPTGLATDQRGEKRLVNSFVKNAPGGDGTDIGSVEVQRFTGAPGPVPPTPEPPTPTPPTPARDLAPRALIKRNGLRARRDSRRVVSGVATDDKKVVRVEVSVVSKRGSVCRDMRKSRKFSRRHRCGKPRIFLRAKGTKKWSFKLANRLPPGYYVVYARATDSKGHVQKVYDTKNRRPFRVRKGG